MLPTNSPGVKFICRTSYEMNSTVMGSPFDYPLSSRLDENDAVFIMDKCWCLGERVRLTAISRSDTTSFRAPIPAPLVVTVARGSR